jgi:hypothetical protein
MEVRIRFEGGAIDGADLTLADGRELFAVVVAEDRHGRVVLLGEEDGVAVSCQVEVRRGLLRWQEETQNWFVDLARASGVADEIREATVLWAVVGADPTPGTARLMRRREAAMRRAYD